MSHYKFDKKTDFYWDTIWNLLPDKIITDALKVYILLRISFYKDHINIIAVVF